MESTYKCALQGFSEGERSTFVSFFKMTLNLGIAFEYAPDTKAAHVVIVNADDAGSSESMRAGELAAKVLFIGEDSPDPRWPCVPRPIRLTKVLQTLQRLVTAWPAGPAPAAQSPSVAVRAPIASVVPSTAGRAGLPADGRAGTVGTSILVVDDSDIALKFMRSRLERFGFRVDLAQSGEHAIVSAREHDYDMVFIDVMMEGIDGYQTCKLIKRKHNGGKAPIAVMLTSRGGTIDKLRGSLAGCDGYITKPITETELMKVLVKHALI